MSAKNAETPMKINGFPLEIHMRQEQIDVTSDRESPDPNWRETDSQGHEHYYDYGYPTLYFVVDEQHWCDGTEGLYNHDPHWAVDKAHYECKLCGQVVNPKTLPPFTPQFIPDIVSIEATVHGDPGEFFEYEYRGRVLEFQRVSRSFGRDSPPVSQYVGYEKEISNESD